MNNLRTYIGDNKTLRIQLPSDPTGLDSVFKAKRLITDADSASVFNKAYGTGISYEQAGAYWFALIDVVPADLAALTAEAVLVWSLRMTDLSTGKTVTTISGQLVAVMPPARGQSVELPINTTSPAALDAIRQQSVTAAQTAAAAAEGYAASINPSNLLTISAQTLTEPQKAQKRADLGAASTDDIEARIPSLLAPVQRRRSALDVLRANQFSSPHSMWLWQYYNSAKPMTSILTPLPQQDSIGNLYAEYVFWAMGGSAAPAGSAGTYDIGAIAVSRPFVVVPYNSGQISKTGANWSTGTGSAYRGGGYNTNTGASAGDTITCSFTGTSIGAWLYSASVCGFVLVSIDGDPTAATALPVVTQALIDAGYFTQSQLGFRFLQNGCSYYDGSWHGLPNGYDRWELFADGLTNSSHTVTLTVTGKPGITSIGTQVRCMVTAFGYSSPAVSFSTANATPAQIQKIIWPSSIDSQIQYSELIPVMQFASKSGGTGFAGGYHGGESNVSWSISANGATVTPAAGALTTYNSIVLNRVTTITPGATLAVNRTTSFVFNGTLPGQCAYDDLWSFAASDTIYTPYCGMAAAFAMDAAGNTVFPFTRGVNLGATVDFSGDSAPKGQSRSDLMAMVGAAQPFVYALSSRVVPTAGIPTEPGSIFYDYTSYRKMYFALMPNSTWSGGQDGFQVSSSTAFRFQSAISLQRIPGLCASLP